MKLKQTVRMPQAERRAAPETILQALSSDPAPGLCRRCPIGENAAFPFPPTGQTLKIAKDTAVTVSMRVTDTKGMTIDDGKRPVAYLHGGYDGIFAKLATNVWTSAGDGVHCYTPDGVLIGKIRVPEVVANVCFGGPKRNRLFICATQTSCY